MGGTGGWDGENVAGTWEEQGGSQNWGASKESCRTHSSPPWAPTRHLPTLGKELCSKLLALLSYMEKCCAQAGERGATSPPELQARGPVRQCVPGLAPHSDHTSSTSQFPTKSKPLQPQGSKSRARGQKPRLSLGVLGKKLFSLMAERSPLRPAWIASQLAPRSPRSPSTHRVKENIRRKKKADGPGPAQEEAEPGSRLHYRGRRFSLKAQPTAGEGERSTPEQDVAGKSTLGLFVCFFSFFPCATQLVRF